MDPHKRASQHAHLEECQMPIRRKPALQFGWNCPHEVGVSVQIFRPFYTRPVSVRLWCPPCSLYLPPSTTVLWISARAWNAAPSSKAMRRETCPSAFLRSTAAQTAREHFSQEGPGFFAIISLFSFDMGGTGESVCLHVHIAGLKALPPRNIWSNLR